MKRQKATEYFDGAGPVVKMICMIIAAAVRWKTKQLSFVRWNNGILDNSEDLLVIADNQLLVPPPRHFLPHIFAALRVFARHAKKHELLGKFKYEAAQNNSWPQQERWDIWVNQVSDEELQQDLRLLFEQVGQKADQAVELTRKRLEQQLLRKRAKVRKKNRGEK